MPIATAMSITIAIDLVIALDIHAIAFFIAPKAHSKTFTF